MQEKTAEIELKQTELQRQSLASRVSDLEVKSEIEGTVISVNQEAASKNQIFKSLSYISATQKTLSSQEIV